MRWVAALVALCSIGAAVFYLLAVRDRTFRSYAGVELGMPLGAAVNRLQTNGYMIVHGPPQVRNRLCTGHDTYALVYAADPTYSLTISADQNCKVRQIGRKLRDEP